MIWTFDSEIDSELRDCAAGMGGTGMRRRFRNGKTYIAPDLSMGGETGYRVYGYAGGPSDLSEDKGCFRHAMKTYKRIMKAQLLAIDNATLFPLKRENVMLLFKLVNEFQEKTSLIVTANYSLTE